MLVYHKDFFLSYKGKKLGSADFVFVHRHFLLKPSINTNIQYSADHKIKLPNTLLYL